MKHEQPSMTQQRSKVSHLLLGAVALATLVAGEAAIAADALRDGRIGYVMTERRWAVYETEGGKTECPHGFNLGPREQFELLFPKSSGKVYTEMESHLMREGGAFHATDSKEPFPFYDAGGTMSYGMNLDGKIGPNDFQSPEGVKGIDNQLYRAIGCIGAYRMNGVVSFFDTNDMFKNGYNRWMIELTGVDNLTNDDDVTVTTYRGLDDLQRDGTGAAFAPGATQEVDVRWGQSFVFKLKGKIVNGVLTTDPIDTLKWPNSQPGVSSGYYDMRGARLQLNLTQQTATGLMVGYVDVEGFSHQLNTNWATHHQSYGQLSAPSLHRALRRLADGYPDPKTGVNTAISSAIQLTLTQVFLVHPDQKNVVAAAGR
ncbi:MAG TPA: hypothetical protein VGN07_20685 [Steroidobacteraceae bacterium]|jgi:hypothetical protein